MSYAPQQWQDRPPMQDQGQFVRRTYSLLLFALLGITGSGVAAYTFLPQAALLPVGIVDAILWIACGWFGWRRPINLVMPLFTIATGLMLGLLATIYPAAIFLQAAVLTIAAFVGLSVYAHTTKQDFSYLKGFLSIAFWVILASALLLLFFPVKLLTLGISALGVVTFGCWILYDTGKIVNRSDSTLTPGVAAFELLLDIIGLFRWIMDLLDEFR
ncbi:MAG: Bax inhibitor-1 family protein [Armatimonas sp.]